MTVIEQLRIRTDRIHNALAAIESVQTLNDLARLRRRLQRSDYWILKQICNHLLIRWSAQTTHKQMVERIVRSVANQWEF